MAKTCYITVRDEVFCNVTGLEPQDQEFLENKFAILMEGAFWHPKVRLGVWNGKIAFFDKAGKIYSRLLPDVLPYIEAWNYDVKLNDLRLPVQLIDTRLDKDWFIRKPEMQLRVELRPYQVNAVNACLEATSGFIELPTASGKTFCIAALSDVLTQHNLRTIVIVPSEDLVIQTAATFRLCLLDVGTYSGAKKDIYHSVVVATWQAMQNNPGLMSEFKATICDESHGAKAKVIGDLINKHGKHIAYRFGFTGTMPKPLIDQMTLRGSIGEVLLRITASDLMEMGYLAQVEIEPVEVNDGLELDADGKPFEFPDYGSEKTFLSKSPKRLDFLADLIISKAQQHGNTFVLVNSIKQGQQLQKLIKDSVFLYGASESDVRAEWYSLFEGRDDLIVIATFGIASVGISINRMFCLVMIDAGKSFIRCLQAIGRSLRKGRDKGRAYVVDVHSNLKWSKKHFRERNKYYKEVKYPVSKLVKYRL